MVRRRGKRPRHRYSRRRQAKPRRWHSRRPCGKRVGCGMATSTRVRCGSRPSTRAMVPHGLPARRSMRRGPITATAGATIASQCRIYRGHQSNGRRPTRRMSSRGGRWAVLRGRCCWEAKRNNGRRHAHQRGVRTRTAAGRVARGAIYSARLRTGPHPKPTTQRSGAGVSSPARRRGMRVWRGMRGRGLRQQAGTTRARCPCVKEIERWGRWTKRRSRSFVSIRARPRRPPMGRHPRRRPVA